MLLRSDVHTVFDRGNLTVTPDYRLRLSPPLRDDFDNGNTTTSTRNPSSGYRARQRIDRHVSSWNGTYFYCNVQ